MSVHQLEFSKTGIHFLGQPEDRCRFPIQHTPEQAKFDANRARKRKNIVLYNYVDDKLLNRKKKQTTFTTYAFYASTIFFFLSLVH
jgi:hypothetical protein